MSRTVPPDLDVVPRSHPLGYLEGRSAKQQLRAKLRDVARLIGRDGWTRAEKHRWEFALGLTTERPPALDKPERPGSQRSDHPRDLPKTPYDPERPHRPDMPTAPMRSYLPDGVVYE